MDRGTQVLIASRSFGTVRLSIGMVGSPYDDATHQIMVRNRDRIYTHSPPYDASVRDEHENLFQQWFAFYSLPEGAPDEMTAPQRARWYRERALEWQRFLDQGDVVPTRSMSNVPLIALGGMLLGVITIAALRK